MTDDDRFKDLDRVLEEVNEMLDLTEESRQLNELRALQLLLEVTRNFHTHHNLYELMTLVLDSILVFADGDRAFLLLFDDDTDELRCKMGRTRQQEYIPQPDFTPSTGIIDKTLARKRAIIVPDAQIDSELNKRMSIQNLQLRSIMCAPLMIKTEVIGLLYVDSRRSVARFSASHLNVITSLADQSAIAIRNAQKFETRH